MRKLLLFFAGIVIASLLSFKVAYDLKSNTAEAEQIQGFYIFTDCKPVKEYEYLGSVKETGSFGSSQYQGVRDRLLKKMRKEYPRADGIIFHFKDGGVDVADAIKFK